MYAYYRVVFKKMCCWCVTMCAVIYMKCVFIFSNVCEIVIYNNRYHKF